jgi:hypothetical protein
VGFHNGTGCFILSIFRNWTIHNQLQNDALRNEKHEQLIDSSVSCSTCLSPVSETMRKGDRLWMKKDSLKDFKSNKVTIDSQGGRSKIAFRLAMQKNHMVVLSVDQGR